MQESTKESDEAKVKALLEKMVYTLNVSTGQRKYGGPPPDSVYSGVQHGIETEVFIGKIQETCVWMSWYPFVRKLVLSGIYRSIWFCLMMDPLWSGQRICVSHLLGKEAAPAAVKLCESYEICPGKHLGVCISVANNRLFVGSIPKNKTKENILEEFSKVTGKTKMNIEVGFWESLVLFINKCCPQRR